MTSLGGWLALQVGGTEHRALFSTYSWLASSSASMGLLEMIASDRDGIAAVCVAAVLLLQVAL